jgi:ClpP class serine protease
MVDGSLLDLIIGNLWIILLIIIFVIPMVQRYFILYARRRLLYQLREQRGTQLVTLIHRQETISFLGIPIARYIDIDDSEVVLRAIRMTPRDVPIDMVLHTPGGLALAATQIALALRAHPGKKTVIIPHYAMSGGTLIALAADEIIMDPYAALGPVDPQLVDRNGVYPAVSLVRVLEKKNIHWIDDRTIVLADEAKKALDQIGALVRRLLSDRYEPGRTEEIVQELVSGEYPHDHPFMAEDAMRLLGDRVNTNVPAEVYDLMKLYRMEVARRRPGVEYVPVAPKG